MTTLSDRWHQFWFEYEVRHTRLVLFRIIFFGLLAFDQWLLMFPHAPRYGIAGFNVGHIPAFDSAFPLPTVGVVGVAYLVGGFLSARVALGISVDVSLRLLTILYGAVYFSSQIDSYQHHYLIALLLFVCWFLPLGGDCSQPEDRDDESPSMVRSWATRLIYVEVSVVYFYTAVTKTTASWLDGTALQKIITSGEVADLHDQVSLMISDDGLAAYAITAHTIMIWQYFVAVSFLIPRLRPVACITGPIFHVLVELINLKIGWFSYYMIGIYYLFLMPDAWFLALGKPLAPLGDVGKQLRAALPEHPLELGLGALVAAGTGFFVGYLTYELSVEGALPMAIILGGLVCASLWPRADKPMLRPTGAAAAQVIVIGCMLLSLGVGDALFDYHRYWAGDLRRRGNLEQAVEHYEAANAAQPDGVARHFALAEVYERTGNPAKARVAFEEGLRREPDSARGQQGLARLDSR